MENKTVRNDRVAELLLNFRKTCYAGCESKFEDFLGPDIYPRLLGRMLSLFAAGPNKANKYDPFLDENSNMPQRLPISVSGMKREIKSSIF